MIQDKMKVLIVEDNQNDARLIDYHTRKIISDPEITIVDTFENFATTLAEFNPDIILCDYRMNGFTGMEVLKYTVENSGVSDFIFITGTIYDEELAAQTILSGATGYVLKKNMNILHKKLLPYFEQVLDRRQRLAATGYEEMLSSIDSFLKDASRDNKTHIESYTQIKKSLRQIHLNNTDI